MAGFPACKSENAEDTLWKRVTRKNKELARILGEQWIGIPAVGFFFFPVLYLFSGAREKTCQFQARAGSHWFDVKATHLTIAVILG